MDVPQRGDAASRMSEEKYRALIDSLEVGLCVIEMIDDGAGKAVDYLFLEVNQVFERQTGLRNAAGRRGSEIDPRRQRFWMAGYAAVAHTGQPLRFERYHQATGRWYLAYASRVDGPGSRQVAIVFDDVSERKRHELRQEYLLELSDALRPPASALEIQRAAIKVLGEHLQVDRVFYAEFDPGGRDYFIPDNYVRGAFPKRLGRIPADVFPSMVRRLAAGETPVVSDVRQTGLLTEAEREAATAARIFALIGVPLIKEGRLVAQLAVQQGRPRYWTADEVAIVQETAERTWAAVERAQAEEALRQKEKHLRYSEERLRTLADSVPQIIWTNGEDGQADYFNLRWYDYTGLSFEESYGLGWEAVVHPDDAPASRREWAQSLAAGKIFDCDYRLRGADGSYRWFVGRNVPMKDAEGRVLGWFGSATDIQDLKTAQAELQEADRRKNHFLAILGHELRNPLAAIRNGVSLLRSPKAKPESQAVALPIVADQVQHMERLVDDLLDLTRVVQGSVQVQREPMALQEALQQALEMARPQAEGEGFAIAIEVPETPLEMLGDRVRLTQIFMNVLSNAIKYSAEARRIEVSARRAGPTAVVRVRDYGVGISRKLLPRIFEPFVQATPGLTLQAGLGLGLAVVRQLVRLHDGEVEAFSAGPNQGTELVLTFPLREGARDA